MRLHLPPFAATLLAGSLFAAHAEAAGAANLEPAPTSAPATTTTASTAPHGSLMTTEALGPGNVSMAMAGGVAVLFPLYRVELGVGVNPWLDVVGRFETVIGVLQFPGVGVRVMPLHIGTWRAGARLDANYFLFGIQSDRLNLTSSFYFTPELGISGPITKASEMSFGLGGEVDVFHLDVIDDETEVVGDVAWDATMLRMVFSTVLTEEIDGFAQLRVRVPTETFSLDGQDLLVMPLLDIGASWVF